MREVVSRWVYVVSLVASMSVVFGVFVPGFAVAGLVALSLTLSVALALVTRTSSPSIGDVIGDVETEPALAFVPAPKQFTNQAGRVKP
jgi:hypothetical protein